tara:strand:+ start:1182 stop:2771 length:1590 start_codon:yes stop_codon:yes gene_type:complete
MDNIYDTFSDYFHSAYKKNTYLDKYGGSTVITAIVLLSFFTIFSYYYIESNIEPIRQNWVNERCKPSVMPFAGYINAPKGKSQLDYTNENFIQCTTSILSKVVELFTKPIYYISDLLSQFYALLMGIVNKVRLFMFYLREKLKLIFEYMIARVVNTMIPMQNMLIKIKDLLNKISGTMVAGLMTVYGAYLTLKSFVGAFLQICITILIIMAAAIILLWILPFTWPAAAAGTAFFVLISVPIILVVTAMVEILNVHPSKKVPGKPGCFDKSTLIKTKTGWKKISNIKVGEILENDSKVTAIFKIDANTQDMYYLNGVSVSGSHKVFYKKLGWIDVKDHPHAKLMNEYNEPIIYCLNTSQKRIHINNMIFMDWDELTPTDMMKLKLRKFIPMQGGYENIHKYIESGLDAETIIETQTGKKIQICNIKPNDILVNGDKVICTVEIDGSDLKNIQQYRFGGQDIIGGPNLFLKHKDLGNLSVLGFKGKNVTRSKLYHLITDTGSFQISNLLVKDYNSAIENILDIHDEFNLLF